MESSSIREDLRMGAASLPKAGLPRQAEHQVRGVFLYLGIGVIVVLLTASTGNTRGQYRQHAGHSLGAVDFPISCSRQAQVEFNRALALLHHMTYPQAKEAFQQVAAADPPVRNGSLGHRNEPVSAALANAAGTVYTTPNAG